MDEKTETLLVSVCDDVSKDTAVATLKKLGIKPENIQYNDVRRMTTVKVRAAIKDDMVEIISDRPEFEGVLCLGPN